MPNGDNGQKEKDLLEREIKRNSILRQQLERIGISPGALQLPVGTSVAQENIAIKDLIASRQVKPLKPPPGATLAEPATFERGVARGFAREIPRAAINLWSRARSVTHGG